MYFNYNHNRKQAKSHILVNRLVNREVVLFCFVRFLYTSNKLILINLLNEPVFKNLKPLITINDKKP